MAGILNNKERVMDFILTERGRKQLLAGELQIKFATYSDIHAFYEGTGGVADDASDRIYLEAYSRNQDNITPETEFNGDILNFQSGDIRLAGASILSNNVNSTDVTDAANIFATFLSGSVQNFTQNYILGEVDEFNPEQTFSASNKLVNFFIKSEDFEAAVPIESMPSFFQDDRFRTISNFAFLPPVDFISSKEKTQQTFQDVRGNIKASLQNIALQEEEISFQGKNINQDLMVQFFQQDRFGQLKKLHVLDIGKNVNTLTGEIENQYQVGKIFTKLDGSDCFFDIFSLAFKK
jgi:hypothetical protein